MVTLAFSEIASGEWTLALFDQTRRPLTTTGGSVEQRAVVVRDGTTVTADFTVARPDGSIRGEVVRSDGEPEPGAFVTAVREVVQSSSGWEGARSSAAQRNGVLVDADGAFEIDGLVDGTYTILAQVRGDGREAMRQQVSVGSEVTLELQSPASISGTLTPAPGRSLPGFYVLQLANLDTGWRRSQAHLRASQGWTAANVPAGRYLISVRSASGSGAASTEVGEGENKTGVALVLEGETTVIGRAVALEDERPLPGFRVIATAANANLRSPSSFADRRNITGADGTFRVTSSPTGRVTLHVIPEFLGDRDPSLTQAHTTYDVTAGQVTNVGDIAIPETRLGNGQRPGDFGFDLPRWDHQTDQATLTTKVVVVRKGSAAAEAGVQVGDELVRMDGREVAGNGRYIYEYRKRVPPGTAAVFEFARREGGPENRREVELIAR